MPRKVHKQIADAMPSQRRLVRDEAEAQVDELAGMIAAIDGQTESQILAVRAAGTETDEQRAWLADLNARRVADAKKLDKRDRYRESHNGMDKREYKRSLMTADERDADDELGKRQVAEAFAHADAFSRGEDFGHEVEQLPQPDMKNYDELLAARYEAETKASRRPSAPVDPTLPKPIDLQAERRARGVRVTTIPYI
jgi:hypothetical protein